MLAQSLRATDYSRRGLGPSPRKRSQAVASGVSNDIDLADVRQDYTCPPLSDGTLEFSSSWHGRPLIEAQDLPLLASRTHLIHFEKTRDAACLQAQLPLHYSPDAPQGEIKEGMIFCHRVSGTA
jgi:hypothetical protein